MKISQREAHRLRKRVNQLEEALIKQRKTWSQEYVGGVEIGRVDLVNYPAIPSAIRTARKLDHAVVTVGDDGNTIRFVALPHFKAGL